MSDAAEVIEPLRRSFTVACSPARAFRTWTEDIGIWWPPGHTSTGEPAAAIVFEPFAGGRLYERTTAGEEVDWGEVLAWEPPHRVVYLWHLRFDRADATEVEVGFAPAGDGACEVTIEHRGWERLGAEKGRERRTRNERGWGGVIPPFVAACAGG